jgi:hypothetical protein
MNERINNLRLDAGISQLEDDPRLVVIDREGNVIDPSIGLEKFAQLIVRECANRLRSEVEFGKAQMTTANAYKLAFMSQASDIIEKHFGVE